jgi:hypothetical protein
MNFRACVSVACLSIVVIADSVSAQSDPRYVRFPGVPASVKGALYMPDAPLPAPHVGILVMHRTSNFMSTLACTELSKRGFAVLCMNPRSDNNEALVRFETIPLDVSAGVQFLKKQTGITKIILWGFSGGGATMTFYESVAETGPSVCQGPNKLVQCSSELAGLAPADGLILVDAIRSTDSMDGIDNCSSNNSPPCHLPYIRVPLLVAAMGAHYFIRDNEIHYEVAASRDKDFVVVEGAEHGQTPCVPCESVPGQYSNAVRNFYNYAADWINRRFLLSTP